MSYAVLHIAKSGGSCNAIARHIERTTSPDNAHPELRHLNRDDFVRYPEGVASLAEAVQYRLDHAGLTRKIGKNQVLALHVLLTSDGNAFHRLAEEGRLNEWAETSIQWAKETFGAENVIGAHLHMDERTPHLHVTVVPIVTTERKRKAREQNAKKRYRTKSKNGPRLSADDVMTRENLTRFQDTYAEAMKSFGLERGVRGSEARHVDQHEYYRQCQIEKKDLEKDVAKLTTEKKKLGKEKKSLEKDTSELQHEKLALETSCKILDNRKAEIEKKSSVEEHKHNTLLLENYSLESENKRLKSSNEEYCAKVLQIADYVGYYADKAQEFMDKKHQAQSGTADDFELLNKFFPEVLAMLPAIRECREVRIADNVTKVLLDKQPRSFSAGAKIYDPVQQEEVDVSHERVEFKRDPSDNKFHLHLGGLRIFQWLKQKWQSLRQTIRSGFKLKH